MVFQKVYLFNDTILNNIKFGKSDATKEEIRNLADRNRTSCDSYGVERLRDVAPTTLSRKLSLLYHR